MRTLWTPDGEWPVGGAAGGERRPAPAERRPGAGGRGDTSGPARTATAEATGTTTAPEATRGAGCAAAQGTDLSASSHDMDDVSQAEPLQAPGDGDEAEARAAAERLRRELAGAPAETVVANHAYGLFELASIYLSEKPPKLEQATLAIDALAGLADSVRGRLGPAGKVLDEAISQIKLAYVQISGTVSAVRQGAASPLGDVPATARTASADDDLFTTGEPWNAS